MIPNEHEPKDMIKTILLKIIDEMETMESDRIMPEDHKPNVMAVEIDADVHISFLGGTGQHAHQEPQIEADVHFALTEPGSGIVHLKIHEPGEFVFYCSVPGHRENGMVGTLIVQPSDS